MSVSNLVILGQTVLEIFETLTVWWTTMDGAGKESIRSTHHLSCIQYELGYFTKCRYDCCVSAYN